LTFHGLRKNVTGALLEAGCTPEEVKTTDHRMIPIMKNRVLSFILKLKLSVSRRRI
jgi:hypothetical protein